MKVNNYVLSADGLRVFIGTEARDIEPLRKYREERPAVDIALLPIDGSALMGHGLVMNASRAVEASRVLGARILIPIHYALRPILVLLQTTDSITKLMHLAAGAPDLDIIPLETGRRWTWPHVLMGDGSPPLRPAGQFADRLEKGPELLEAK